MKRDYAYTKEEVKRNKRTKTVATNFMPLFFYLKILTKKIKRNDTYAIWPSILSPSVTDSKKIIF